MPMGQDMQHTDATRIQLTPDTISAATYLFLSNEQVFVWISNIRAQEKTISLE